MAADSNRFPLHNAIKKILDDPNSRPKLPGLEPEPASTFPENLIGFFPDGGWSDVPIFSPESLQAIQTVRSDEKVKRAVISGSPAVAVFQDKLYVVFEGGNNDGWLYYASYDGKEPAKIKKLGNDSNKVSGSPALVVFQDKLYCVHAEVGETGWLYYCTFDGQKWSDSEKLPNHGTSMRKRRYPCASLAVFKGVLCCVHEGYGSKDGKGWLWYCTFNGQEWSKDQKLPNHSTNGGGSLTDKDGERLVCLYERNDGSGSMRYTYTEDLSDTKNWSEDKEFVLKDDKGEDLACKTSGPPGVTIYGGNSYWVHEGPGNNGEIWSFNNKSFIDRPMLMEGSAPQGVLGTSGPPAVVSYKDKFYIARQGPGDNGQILMTGTLAPLPPSDRDWIELQGDNSYCYCACSATDDKPSHTSSHTMNVKAGAPYFYAVFTKDDDSIDFPAGAVLTIEGSDGTKYDRDIQEENQLVIMSGSSVRCLIVKDPKPGDWKMTMTVPEGVGFHCECNTVPSKDVYSTITNTLRKTNQLKKRGLSDDEQGWAGSAAGVAIAAAGVTAATESLEISVAFSIAGTTLALTPLGVFFLAAAVGISAVAFLSSVASVKEPSEPSKQVSKITTDLTNASRTISATPPPTPQPVAAQDALQLYISDEGNSEANDGLGDFEILLQDGTRFTYRSYLEWVAAIRTQSGAGNTTAVRLNINGVQSPWIRVRSGDFYVLAFSQADDPWANGAWRDIPGNLINYPGEIRINISSQSIQNAMLRVRRWIENPGTALEVNSLTILIFASAEAARFDGVAFAVNALLREQVTNYDWLYFRRMLTSWSFISENIYRLPHQPGVSLFVSRALAGSSRRGNQNLFNYMDQLATLGYPLGYRPSR